MRLYFIRHGKTKGNQEGRYVGRTDEPLLPETKKALEMTRAKEASVVVASPMLRCIQTAQILYPHTETWVIPELKEMDFGSFEYRNYQELNGDAVYQAFLDSGGKTAFPHGETRQAFQQRCVRGFLQAVARLRERQAEAAAFVVHGGTIMAVLETYGVPRKDYFEWQIKNGESIEGELDDKGNIYIRK